MLPHSSNTKVVTFGEVLMRLSAPGYTKFPQANQLDMDFGGGEANVAIALAYLGMDAEHITRFPDNMIGRTATQFLRKHWLKTGHIVYGGDKLGHYFLERGAVHRSSRIVYDRDDSAFSEITPDMVNWEEVFKDACWFHWTGISVAISQGVLETCMAGIEAAQKMGVRVSADLTFRQKQWQYGKDPKDIMPKLIKGCDVLISGVEDIARLLGFEPKGQKDFESYAREMVSRFPNIAKIADKKRESLNASFNRIQGKLFDGDKLIESPVYEITHIIDRVGTGDAYAAGLIYGLINLETDKEAVDFAAASCALKHTVEGDANMVSFEDVNTLVQGDLSGKIRR